MRAKILVELRKKFPGLSVEFLGLLAIKLESKVTEESQIEGVVTGLDNLPIPVTELAAEFQKEGDRRVTAAEKKWKTENPPKDPKPDPTDPPADPKPGDANALLMKELKELRNDFNNLKTQSTQKSLSEKLHAKLTEKKIPVKLAIGRKLEKDEDLDTVLGEIEADYSELKQGFIDQGLLSATIPPKGETTLRTDNADNDIKSWAQSKKAPEAAKA